MNVFELLLALTFCLPWGLQKKHFTIFQIKDMKVRKSFIRKLIECFLNIKGAFELLIAATFITFTSAIEAFYKMFPN